MTRKTLIWISAFAVSLYARYSLPAALGSPHLAPQEAARPRSIRAPATATSGISDAILGKFIIASEKATQITAHYDSLAKAMMSAQQKAALRRALNQQKQQVESAVTWVAAAKTATEISARQRKAERKLKPVRTDAFLSVKQRAVLLQAEKRDIRIAVSHIMPYSKYRALEKRFESDPEFQQRVRSAGMNRGLSHTGPPLPWYAQLRTLNKAPPGCLQYSGGIVRIRGTLVVGMIYGPPYVTDRGTPRPALFIKLNPPLSVCHIPNPQVVLSPRPATLEDLFNGYSRPVETGVAYYNVDIPGLLIAGNWLGYGYQRWRMETVEKLIDPYLMGRVEVWARLWGEANSPDSTWITGDVVKVCRVRHHMLVQCQGQVPASASVVSTIESPAAASE